MVQVDEEAEDGDTFEMKCKYGPTDECILDCFWEKLHEDGTSTSISEDPRFETTTDDKKGNSLLKILKVTSADAGEYQCIVKLHGGRQLVANRMLVIKKAPFSLEIPDVPTNEGISIVRLYLKFTEVKGDSLKDISDIRWYRGESRETGCLLAHLKKKFTRKRYTAGLEIENSLAFLTIEVITTEDAGEYSCEVDVKGRKLACFCTGSLKVEGPILKSVNARREAIKGEDAELCWHLFTPLEIDLFIFYKKLEDELKEVVRSDDLLNVNRCKAVYLQEEQQFILKISDVENTQAGFYMLKCFTKNTLGDGIVCYSSTTSSLTVDRDETIHTVNVLAFEKEDSATLTCVYNLKSKVDIQRWFKKTSKGKEVIFESDKSEKTETVGQKYEADFDEKFARLKINQVTVSDAGVYTCEVVSKKKISYHTQKTSATLVVPWDVFGSGLVHENHCVYRHPAVVLANKHFIVFCEEHVNDNCTRGLVRRGKLMEHNRIEWENQQPILDKTGTRFQNLVPIVVDEKKGEIILLCVEYTAQQDGCKLIQLTSYNNGEKWSDPTDVHLKWPEDMQESAQLHCIGPGHGLCLKSGKLAVAGFIKFSEQVHLCVIISDSRGATWEVVRVPSSCSPNSASFGKHAQLVEYAKDKVCITCSLEDCQQRFNMFSNDGCRTFHKGKLEPELIETNPGCQAGIISIPETKKGFNLIAFTNPAHQSNFEKLSVRLSKDGCVTWTDPCPPLIGRRFAAASDLAYYEGKDNRGLACVYENINITEGKKENDYCILMQLISLDEIMQKKSK